MSNVRALVVVADSTAIHQEDKSLIGSNANMLQLSLASWPAHGMTSFKSSSQEAEGSVYEVWHAHVAAMYIQWVFSLTDYIVT